MTLNTNVEILFLLLRAGLRTEKPGDPERLRTLCSERTPDWPAIYALASRQGVLAIAWDGLERLIQDGTLAAGQQPTRSQKLQWGFNTDRTEQTWTKQRKAIVRLSAFFGEHGIPTMLLKGYGISLCYPVPEHRPCGDIDIWLFGQQERADRLLHEEKGVAVNTDKHHHTKFHCNGILVENHFDLLNVHSHPSNREIDAELRRLAASPEQGEEIRIDDRTVYLPSPDFNALFLLRHTAMHFAAVEIGLRHATDWGMFVNRYHDRIDWEWFETTARNQNMHIFLHCLNAICSDLLGIDPAQLPAFPRDPAMEQRVLDEILQPGFSEQAPTKNLLKSLSLRLRRWWANRWKHRIVYKEGLLRTFFIQLYSHLLKPKSLVE